MDALPSSTVHRLPRSMPRLRSISRRNRTRAPLMRPGSDRHGMVYRSLRPLGTEATILERRHRKLELRVRP